MLISHIESLICYKNLEPCGTIFRFKSTNITIQLSPALPNCSRIIRLKLINNPVYKVYRICSPCTRYEYFFKKGDIILHIIPLPMNFSPPCHIGAGIMHQHEHI